VRIVDILRNPLEYNLCMPPRTDRVLPEGDRLPPTFSAYVCAPRQLAPGTILRPTSFMRTDEEFQLFWHTWDPKVIFARLMLERGPNAVDRNTCVGGRPGAGAEAG
jgi:hypothetical protein